MNHLPQILGIGFIITIILASFFLVYHSHKKNVKEAREKLWEEENSQW